MKLKNGWKVHASHRLRQRYGDFQLKDIIEGMEQEYDTQAHTLSVLMLNGVVFTNGYWWKKREGWTKEDAELTGCFVNLNDVFAWAACDAEDLPHDEVDELFRHWLRDPAWGPAVWAMKRRKMLPQKPVMERIKEAGVWTTEELEVSNAVD